MDLLCDLFTVVGLILLVALIFLIRNS